MRGGGFFQQDVRSFDNTFFGISNLEAQYLSPSQRNLLEVVFECFESGGIRMSDVAGTNVGCYVNAAQSKLCIEITDCIKGRRLH